ncbi:hypothetical protein [Chitinophaga sp. sic0106]|uniref:hypothetical protein n=1 Tax=Chitinophaga sp. sic0106 TaxID=2854785 RepID=UPI001C45FF4F|nr:hypothetical protein [Chitinophaga sp. sic0106]MBV7529791.1 hypothetical protein [Chitinophaga sp. sic0106]
MLTLPDIVQPYWGKIVDSRGNGFTSSVQFSHPFFGTRKFSVYLGDSDISHTPVYIAAHPGSYYKPLEPILGPDYCLLDEFAATYQDFVLHREQRLLDYQEEMYSFFLSTIKPRLPEMYETYPTITSLYEHNLYVRNVANLRVKEGDVVEMLVYYDFYPGPVFGTEWVKGEMRGLRERHGGRDSDSTSFGLVPYNH